MLSDSEIGNKEMREEKYSQNLCSHYTLKVSKWMQLVSLCRETRKKNTLFYGTWIYGKGN